ncbi:formate dehydrogenase accessory protein FdhE, partial [Streptomyces sp. P9(2023)]|uniref:formate dehydrogenase accessory protein FdhE domain-containing protein n=1 Tax=Streptomyces sp. P9(2023) TaxID=3064394 RepID=UPI0028F3E3DF
MTTTQPDPSMIGGLDKAPFALLSDPVKTFTARAERFEFLARDHQLAPYLSFLAKISRIQAGLCAE